MKKVLSLLLILCLLPCAAWAEDGELFCTNEDHTAYVMAYYREAQSLLRCEFYENDLLITIDHYDENGLVCRSDYYADGKLDSYALSETIEEAGEGYARMSIVANYTPDDVLTDTYVNFIRDLPVSEDETVTVTFCTFAYDAEGTLTGINYYLTDDEGMDLFALTFDPDGSLIGCYDTVNEEFIAYPNAEALPFSLDEIVLPEFELTIE